MIHAVGLGWAERLLGSDRVAITYFGDGATSEGDFHEAMNFAAVFGTPTVFVCENNGWAISMPRSHQTSSETIAEKAGAYGMPGVLVDGNDLLAMVAVTREAVARARGGAGPTLIEALTYRMGPHTTTDDAARYRPGDDVEEWRTRDPIDRVRRYLDGCRGVGPGMGGRPRIRGGRGRRGRSRTSGVAGVALSRRHVRPHVRPPYRRPGGAAAVVVP